AALLDADLSFDNIDAIVLTNMELFEGRALPEVWCGEFAGGAGKPVMKVATGGTSGTSGAIAGLLQAASGVFDTVLVVGWEKHSEGSTQTGMSLTDPAWDRHIASGAIGNFALSISQYVAGRNVTPEQAALVAVKARRNGALNPHAHLKDPDITVEKVLASPMLAEPIHLLDMCPQSDGAAALVIAAGDLVERYKNPAWFVATASRHDQPYFGDLHQRLLKMRTLRDAAAEVYRKAGIQEPLRELDVAEIYEPVSYAELAWYEALGFCEDGQAGTLIESGATQLGSILPVNPSGGVLCANPVGATGVIRVAEAAKQLHQKAGDYQVDGANLALVTGYGVYAWSDVLIFSGEKP
ncbi:MAG: thiolase family protein, partial [bacterium]